MLGDPTVEEGCYSLLGGRRAPLHHIVCHAEIMPWQYQKLCPEEPYSLSLFCHWLFDDYGKVSSAPGVKIM